ncbi:ATPase, FliI/YscN family protein, partial [Thauera sp. 63]
MKHGGELWRDFLSDGRRLVENASAFEVSGRLTRINGLVMEAAGLKLPLGSGCRVLVPGGGAVEAEVVGFNGDKLFMMPTDDVFGLAPGARVLPMEVGVPRLVPGKRIGPRRRAADRAKHLPVGEALLGRVVDGAGRPLD